MTTTTLKVTGMTCGHCVRSVTDAIGALDGVQSTNVELKDGRVVVDATNAVMVPGYRAVDLGGGVKMDFVLIRPGRFVMGSDTNQADEHPAHEVTMTRPYYIGKYEVTQEQWQRPSRRSNGSPFTVETFATYFMHDLHHHLHDVSR
mgnify:CR=1 FL=1